MRRRRAGDVRAEADGGERRGQRCRETMTRRDTIEGPRKRSPGRDRRRFDATRGSAVDRDRGRLFQPRRDETRRVSFSLATLATATGDRAPRERGKSREDAPSRLSLDLARTLPVGSAARAHVPFARRRLARPQREATAKSRVTSRCGRSARGEIRCYRSDDIRLRFRNPTTSLDFSPSFEPICMTNCLLPA